MFSGILYLKRDLSAEKKNPSLNACAFLHYNSEKANLLRPLSPSIVHSSFSLRGISCPDFARIIPLLFSAITASVGTLRLHVIYLQFLVKVVVIRAFLCDLLLLLNILCVFNISEKKFFFTILMSV